MSGVTLRFRGALAALSPADRQALLDRAIPGGDAIRATVARIVAAVRAEGDAALRRLAAELDGVTLDALEVPPARRRAALDATPAPLRAALERTARNLVTTHAAWMPRAAQVETEPGVTVGRRPDPIGRLGVYAPGGRAAYPSSVLMAAVPARVAGGGGVGVCSPLGSGGEPPALVLAACELAGVDRVFALGGAGAVAAMAYGTASVPRVDRIVGPGNAWVMEAKLQVAGQVAIDGPAGPSEVLVLADASAPPAVVARELVAQAEHDPRAAAVAVVAGPPSLAAALDAALAREVAAAARAGVVREALAAAGGILTATGLDEAAAFATDYAPEHLLLAVEDPAALAAGIRNAGSVFLGASSSVAFGDYLTGGNHVLPTGGLARAFSGLVPEDFIRWTTWQRVEPAAAARLAGDVAALAAAEGLPGHAAAARAWEEPA
jgi:histidinol dehydrogenase